MVGMSEWRGSPVRWVTGPWGPATAGRRHDQGTELPPDVGRLRFADTAGTAAQVVGHPLRQPPVRSLSRHGVRPFRLLSQGQVGPHATWHMEGIWPSSQRVVVVEFPDADRAKAWYASSEYADALKVRKTALERRLLLVEGVPE
ncbi:DUF1330 domain-containing protein [Streptomyces sp. OE57]|uniref:DUF1330 domain-containing protein n=1 Tax=Streptomyces lacaronensis TaxID=3379885 RepID=UPI0039B762A9